MAARSDVVPEHLDVPAVGSPDAASVVKNGGFEAGKLTPWTGCRSSESVPEPSISNLHPKNGKYDALVGNTSTSTPEIKGTSSVCQLVIVPKNGELTWWTYGLSNDKSSKVAEFAGLYSEAGKLLKVFFASNKSSNWTKRQYDLSAYGGQKDYIAFGIVGVGDKGKYIAQFVDDVTLVDAGCPSIAGPDAAPCGSQNFQYNGTDQKFTVPAGVTKLTVEAIGADGNADTYSDIAPGGEAQGTLSVTPGEVLYVFVGSTGSGGPGCNGNFGGWNGGGNGAGCGYGGGGASDVRVGGTTLSNRVVVAGGGGGAGCCTSTEAGGGGGGSYPGNGTGGTGVNGQGGAGGGQGATPTSPGSGGAGGEQPINYNPGQDGYDGDLGLGGDGGQAGAVQEGGGGGGGGWYGGGGGGGGAAGANDLASGGGGGGSSYVSPKAFNRHFGHRIRGPHDLGGGPYNGLVTLSW